MARYPLWFGLDFRVIGTTSWCIRPPHERLGERNALDFANLAQRSVSEVV